MAAVVVGAAAALVFGKAYFIRDDGGDVLLWNSDEAYLIASVHRRGAHVAYLEYPWMLLKEALNGVWGPNDQRTSVTVVHVTASGVERHVVEASDEEPANTPDFYTPFEGQIYANYHGSLYKWTGSRFEIATSEEQHRLDGTKPLVATDIDKGADGWSKRGFGNSMSDYEFAVDVGGQFTLRVTNKSVGQSVTSVVSVTLVRPGQPVERIWRLDGSPRAVTKTEYQTAFKR